MMSKYREIEFKLHQSEKQVEEQKQQIEESQSRTHKFSPNKDLVVEEESL